MNSSSRSFLLTDWVTIRGGSTVTSVTQDAGGWVDVSGFADATFFVTASVVTPPIGAVAGLVLLYLETSPTLDESNFLAQPVVGPIPLTASATPFVVKTSSASATPLCRFLRFRLVSTLPASWDATIKIRGVANRTTYFAPTQLGNCKFWVRSDRGLNFGGSTITSWADQSGTNDPNKNLVAPGPGGTATNPTLTSSDLSFANQPSVAFSGNNNCYFTSAGIWANPMLQSDTWVLVGVRNTGVGGLTYFINGNTNVAGFGQAVWASATPDINASAGTQRTITDAWTVAGAVMCEFNGATSNLYHLNSFSSVGSSGAIGTSVVNALSFGSNNVAQAGGGINTWNGRIVEAIAFSGLLTLNQKQLLREYLNNLYALSIT